MGISGRLPPLTRWRIPGKKQQQTLIVPFILTKCKNLDQIQPRFLGAPCQRRWWTPPRAHERFALHLLRQVQQAGHRGSQKAKGRIGGETGWGSHWLLCKADTCIGLREVRDSSIQAGAAKWRKGEVRTRQGMGVNTAATFAYFE